VSKLKSSPSVGLITFHWADNFGSVLQAYALQETVRKLGFNVQIVDFRPTALVDQYRISKPMRRNLKSILKYCVKKILFDRKVEHKISRYEDFRRNFMYLSPKRFLSSEDLKKNSPTYDIYLVGSDQVWNPSFVRDIGFSYLLDFLPPSAYKVSYASSVVEEIPDDFLPKYKYYLEQFRFISVRERSSKEILKKILDKPIEVCLDPVFLLSVEEWHNICEKPKRKVKKPYILVLDYVVNETYRSYVNLLSSRLGLPIVSFQDKLKMKLMRKGYSNHLCSIEFEGPREILWYIANAEIVLTSSFHGLAFALIFNKKFVCMVHPTRGNRMIDLLTDIKMERSLLHPNLPFENIRNIEPVSLSEESYNILTRLKDRSLEYLKSALRT